MNNSLGPLPRAPRKFVRDTEVHGHHKGCCHDHPDACGICICRELDEDDYQAECERRLDAWREGNYREREDDDE